jgi:DNA replication protein DnaC
MTDLIHARVVDRLQRLRLGHVAERLDAMLSDAARKEPSYLDFLDQILAEEVASKQRKRVLMGIQIAHFPAAKTLDGFDFKAQPGVDQKLVRELATGRFVHSA